MHLSVEPRPAIAGALCEWIAAHDGCEIIAGGDWFEFSAVVEGDAPAMWRRVCAANPEVIAALRRHTARGGRLTLLAGNHDAPLCAAADEVICTLGPARCSVESWFVRRGDVHVEHGHLWDRDNAPLHPLADWSHATEPLGIALMRRFVARSGALDFAHAHDTTPVKGLARAFRLYGVRAPAVVVQYFSTAAALCFEAGKRRKLQALEAEALGRTRLLAHASAAGVHPSILESVLAGAPDPTHLRFYDTFMRLYFDRVIAGVAATTSASVAALMGAAPLALGVLGVSSLYLAGSMRAGPRYEGPVAALRQAAALVADALEARCVIFGHTHVPEQGDRYVNIGSFAYSAGRPYAAIRGDSSVQLCYWEASQH